MTTWQAGSIAWLEERIRWLLKMLLFFIAMLWDNSYLRGKERQCVEPGEPQALVISAFAKISTGVSKDWNLRPEAGPGACKTST